MFFQFFAEIKNNFGSKIFRIIRVPAIPSNKFLKIMCVTGVIAFKWFGDKLVPDSEIAAYFFMIDHQPIKNNAVIRFHRKA